MKLWLKLKNTLTQNDDIGNCHVRTRPSDHVNRQVESVLKHRVFNSKQLEARYESETFAQFSRLAQEAAFLLPKPCESMGDDPPIFGKARQQLQNFLPICCLVIQSA